MNRLRDRVVLVVDDDEDILSSIALAMRAEGAETATATDGAQAVARFIDAVPDAVVLDMMLPRQSGFVVLEKIMEYEDPPVVVMITANQGRRHREYAEGLGVSAYLNKPVALERLIETLVELLDRQEAGRAGEA